MAASGNKWEVIMTNDLGRAFFHATARRAVYVQLAREDQLLGDEGTCCKLSYSMYGSRDAAQFRANEYAEMLFAFGFADGRAFPCVFYHPVRRIRNFVHGDDHVRSAQPQQFKWFQGQFEHTRHI